MENADTQETQRGICGHIKERQTVLNEEFWEEFQDRFRMTLCE